MRRSVVSAFSVVLALLGAQPAVAEGQLDCNRNNAGQCQIGNNATIAINITISRATRLELSAMSVALDTPTGTDFENGLGQTLGPTLTVKSNAAWTLSTRSAISTWSPGPPPARADKPAGELRWSTTGVPASFVAYTTSDATIASGSATAGTPFQLYFRVTYAWALDTPGQYFLPIRFTITSP